jgi:hypothetical protein
MKNRFWIEGALEIVFDATKLSPREWNKLVEFAAFLEQDRNHGDLPEGQMFFHGTADELEKRDVKSLDPGATPSRDFLQRLAIEADRNIGRILLDS